MPFKKKTATQKEPAPKKVLKEEPKKDLDEEGEGKSGKTFELLRGFRDILPEDQGRWNLVRDTIRSIAESYSFDRIDLPILER